MKKISKQKAIELILVELEKGSTFSVCFSVLCSKFQLIERTFNNYWKEANTIYQERQQSILKQVEQDNVELEKERLKRQILSKHERMEIASKIAKGEAWKVQNELIVPSAGDRMRALDYLSKVDGDFAVKKVDVTTGGEKINIINLGRGIKPDETID